MWCDYFKIWERCSSLSSPSFSVLCPVYAIDIDFISEILKFLCNITDGYFINARERGREKEVGGGGREKNGKLNLN